MTLTRPLAALAMMALLALSHGAQAQQRNCPSGPLAQGSEGFVAPTPGTDCVIVTGTYAGSESRLGLPVTRRFMRITPQTPGDGVQPLFVLLHARDTNIEPMANLTRIGRLVRDHGITVILPEAIDGEFNDDPITPPTEAPDSPLMDDVAFIATVIADAIADNGIDPAQVFIAGYSNGGFMSQRMVCERPELFAGLGSVASSLRFGLEENCPATPKPMTKVFIHGTDDEVVRYGGVPYRDDLVIDGETTNNARIAFRSAPGTASFWAARNGCSDALDVPPIPNQLPTNGDGTTVDYIRYNCASGVPPLIAYRVNGGGHTWPGSLGFAGGTSVSLGRITTQLDATTAFWAHFSNPRSGSQVMPDQLRPEGAGGGGGALGWGLLGLSLIALLGRRWRSLRRQVQA
ncbi:alpha/beta hydrolase family esterase [Polycyclovorans algicola]|uniref:alpha/beta hydrolase family esterase n=1 Tax=Polycyclovorans algicola TaxID=616992 RepID=UPI001378D03F|nr:PHB depolymerase family esterase [Polycyclovorans algicola]